MNRLTQITLLICLIALSSCKKDKTVSGLNPEGQLLILQLDKDYKIELASELDISVTSTDGKLDLKAVYIDDGGSSIIIIRSKTSGADLMNFKDGVLQTPQLISSPRLLDRDERLHYLISEDAFTPFGSELFDTTGLNVNAGDSRLLHGYYSRAKGNKISILPQIIYEFDPELDISIPTRKYFLIVGL